MMELFMMKIRKTLKMKLILTFNFLILVFFMFSQNKNELNQSILQLEEKIKTLENEISNIKIIQSNNQTSINLLTKSNLDLDQSLKKQNSQIEKLTLQNDSLLRLIKVEQNSKSDHKLMNEGDSIKFLIRSYFACENWEDRLLFCLNPLEIKPFLQERYSNNYKNYQIDVKQININGSGFKLNEVFKVWVEDLLFYCKKTNEGYKIDWEASVGYNPLSLKTYKAKLESNPTEFRVIAELGTYYNYNFRDSSHTHWNIELKDSERNRISCYVRISTKEGKQIYEILKDGKKHNLILELKLDTSQDTSGGTAIITKLIKNSWSKE